MTFGRRRSRARRSRSVRPPQTPNSTRLSRASARHSARTGQPKTDGLRAVLRGALDEQGVRIGVATACSGGPVSGPSHQLGPRPFAARAISFDGTDSGRSVTSLRSAHSHWARWSPSAREPRSASLRTVAYHAPTQHFRPSMIAAALGISPARSGSCESIPGQRLPCWSGRWANQHSAGALARVVVLGVLSLLVGLLVAGLALPAVGGLGIATRNAIGTSPSHELPPSLQSPPLSQRSVIKASRRQHPGDLLLREPAVGGLERRVADHAPGDRGDRGLAASTSITASTRRASCARC